MICRISALLLLSAALWLGNANLAPDSLIFGVPPATAGGGCRPAMSGTFYQPLVKDLEWAEGRWHSLEDALQRLGMTEVFVQWSSADGIAFYPSSALPGPVGSPIDRLFDLARRRQLDVWVGLDLDKDFLPALRKPSAALAAHLQERERRLAGLLPDLAAYLRRQDRLAGWYISAEIDDGAWIDGPAGPAVRRHLQRLSRMLKTAIDRPVAISAFANGHLPPERYAAFWRDTMQEAEIDLLLFQDGVGANKLTPVEAGRYAAALAREVGHANRQFGVIIEQFGQRPAAGSEGPPAFDPAPPARVRQQLDATAALADIRRIAFTVTDYLLPENGDRRLLDALHADLDACR